MKTPSPNLTPRRRCALFAAGLLWAACLITGFTLLAREEFTPVSPTPVASDFPQGSPLSLDTKKPTLLVFLHPQCPCSRATLSELEKILAQTGNNAAVDVVFTIPAGTPPGWEKGYLWSRAAEIPNLRVIRDEKGIAARRFDVIGSGHTLLYSSAGRLLFSGGITASRGEEGDNAGESAVVDLVLHGRADITHAPVFGCSLL